MSSTKNQDFKIGIKTVWFLVVGNLLLIAFGAIAKIQHWEFSQFILSFGLVLFFSTWIIVLSDMTKNKIYNKTFWVMSMLIMPTIAPIIYLIQRNKLLRLGQKFS
ncbi:MAG: hypothetical protein ABR574_07780 [Cryomorphaceae bacterium]|nr:hypothetical protein [Flavobacteriales bacterium]